MKAAWQTFVGSGGIESKSMWPYPCTGDAVLTGEWIFKCRGAENCSGFAEKKGNRRSCRLRKTLLRIEMLKKALLYYIYCNECTQGKSIASWGRSSGLRHHIMTSIEAHWARLARKADSGGQNLLVRLCD